MEKQNGVAVSTNYFVWCGMELCEARTGTGGTVAKRFFAQGEQISGTNYFFTTDHLGSVREMMDSSGTIRARYDYDPYGRRTKVSGTLDADFGFTGHYTHAVSGLHLAVFRAYDPGLARWLNRDPMQEAGGLNLYAYVLNDPLNYFDPYGLKGWNGWWDNPIMNFLTSDNVVNFAAGMGDNLSFNLTNKARDLAGINDMVDRCSNWHKGGEWVGTAVGLAMAGGGIMKGGAQELRTLLSDPRRFKSISNAFWQGRANGRALHHWLIPQSARWVPEAIRNGGWNLVVITGDFNTWMGFAKNWGPLDALLAGTAENLFRAVMFGGLAAPFTQVSICGQNQPESCG